MKTITVGQPPGLDSLPVVERDLAAPKAGEVSVRWHASSLNFHDYMVAVGELPTAAGRIPMSDGAGEIVEIGPGVTQWKVGDKVMSLFFPEWHDGKGETRSVGIISGDTVDGYACELSTLSAEALTPIPQGYSYAEAATLPCAALTAWRILIEECGCRPGDSVLVEGSGGLSIFALQFAKAAGARVYATSSSEEKMERLKALGADEVVNYKTDPKWGKTIHKLSGGGVNHVVDIGGPATLAHSLQAARVGGTVALVGVLGGRVAELMLPLAFFKQLRLQGVAVGNRAMQYAMVRGIEANGIKPVIDKRFGFSELGAAFKYQDTKQHLGKIVVEY